jgi:DNA-binding transcriptional regulator YiaG
VAVAVADPPVPDLSSRLAFGYPRRGMSPDEIKALRKELGCTARELAGALGLEQQTVMAWEREELFPTKRHCDAMEELQKRGPSAIPRKPRKKLANLTPMAALAEPDVWRLFRKLLAHAELRAEVEKLAARYDDPAEDQAR